MRYKSTHDNVEAWGSVPNIARPHERHPFFCGIKSIDPLNDYIELFSFKHGEVIKIPYDPSFKIEKDYLVGVVDIDGVYKIVGRLEIEYKSDKNELFDPMCINEDECIKKRNVEDIGNEYIKPLNIAKKEYDIVQHIGYAGWMIKEKISALFSKISKLVVREKSILAFSESIKKMLPKTKSYTLMTEKENSVFDIRVMRDYSGNIKLIEVYGDVMQGLYSIMDDSIETLPLGDPKAEKERDEERKNKNNMPIEIENMPFDIASACYCRMILSTSKPSMNNEPMNGEWVSEVSTHISKDVLDGQRPKLTIGSDKYYIVSMRAEYDTGEIREFSMKKISFSQRTIEIPLQYSLYTLSTRHTWQHIYDEIQKPNQKSTYKSSYVEGSERHIHKGDVEHRYIKTLTQYKFLENEIFEDNEEGDKHRKNITCNEYRLLGSDIYFSLDNNEFKNGTFAITSSKKDSRFAFNVNSNGFTYMENSGGQDKIFMIHDDSIVMSNYRNIFGANISNVVLPDSMLFISQLRTENGLYITGGDIVASDMNMLFFEGKNFYSISDDVAYFKNSNMYGVSDDSIVLNAGKQEILNDENNPMSVFVMTPDNLSLYAKNLNIPGYCRCS